MLSLKIHFAFRGKLVGKGNIETECGLLPKQFAPV